MVILILIIISSSWQLMGAAAALFLKTNDYLLIGVIATCEILLSDTQHQEEEMINRQLWKLLCNIGAVQMDNFLPTDPKWV